MIENGPALDFLIVNYNSSTKVDRLDWRSYKLIELGGEGKGSTGWINSNDQAARKSAETSWVIKSRSI